METETNENTNSLVRSYFLEGADIALGIRYPSAIADETSVSC